MIFADPGRPGSLLGALESVLGPLGVVLGRSWELLGLSWAILSRSWGILRRSWVALGGSWFALAGSWLAPGRSWRAKRARRAAGQGASVGQGKRGHPPPVGFADFHPPQGSEHEGQGKRKTGLRTTGKREESGPQGRGKSQDHREDGRGKKRDIPHAQRPRGPADLKKTRIEHRNALKCNCFSCCAPARFPVGPPRPLAFEKIKLKVLKLLCARRVSSRGLRNPLKKRKAFQQIQKPSELKITEI